MACNGPVGAALVCALAAGCGDRGETVTVLAAASLTEAFGELGEELERRDPGLTVRFSFAASSSLAAQAAEGAPGDVLATADLRTVRIAQEARVLAGEPVIFARNRLVVAVPRGNPGGVSSLADLARPEVLVALCSRPVPCGAAAQAALGAAGLSVTPVTWERDVKAVLTKVMLGEVDAGLVYATDAQAAGDRVRSFAFPEAEAAVNAYPIAILREAPNPRAARAFVDLVLSETGRAVLTDAGFEVP
ncbi:MAG: molybdate ABC transporter substrate-binding protein [Gemmatimonadota bacterium]